MERSPPPLIVWGWLWQTVPGLALIPNTGWPHTLGGQTLYLGRIFLLSTGINKEITFFDPKMAFFYLKMTNPDLFQLKWANLTKKWPFLTPKHTQNYLFFLNFAFRPLILRFKQNHPISFRGSVIHACHWELVFKYKISGLKSELSGLKWEAVYPRVFIRFI